MLGCVRIYKTAFSEFSIFAGQSQEQPYFASPSKRGDSEVTMFDLCSSCIAHFSNSVVYGKQVCSTLVIASRHNNLIINPIGHTARMVVGV